MINDLDSFKIAILGLGYVGLPLAVEFGKVRPVIGFDINSERIDQLISGVDKTLELTKEELLKATSLELTSHIEKIADCNVYIVTVPTPIDSLKNPDLSLLISATETIGSILKAKDIVIYESTVFPGATEENCVPVLERTSGLTFNKDFFVGYSPERINPGDKKHRLPDIIKVVSGSTPETATKIESLYNQIIVAGTFKAESIRVAEAAKVIENTQRDLNIALINELSIIFSKMNIDTGSVLEAASTKWNFLNFKPGLVGGHCIGVDPYYLTHKALEVGYEPKVILAGRKLNDEMSDYVANKLVETMKLKGINMHDSKILIAGLSFKENCPDVRNTRVLDIINNLSKMNIHIDVYDPWVDPRTALIECGIDLINEPDKNSYDGILVAVAHEHFASLGSDWFRELGKKLHVLFDLKGIFPKKNSNLRL
jgi:UDP-N-acetyl-D-galactosamine dehydrogenase